MRFSDSHGDDDDDKEKKKENYLTGFVDPSALVSFASFDSNKHLLQFHFVITVTPAT